MGVPSTEGSTDSVTKHADRSIVAAPTVRGVTSVDGETNANAAEDGNGAVPTEKAPDTIRTAHDGTTDVAVAVGYARGHGGVDASTWTDGGGTEGCN